MTIQFITDSGVEQVGSLTLTLGPTPLSSGNQPREIQVCMTDFREILGRIFTSEVP